MVPKTLNALLLLIIGLIFSFLIWHFFLSIYEVKYFSPSKILIVDTEYKIKCVGLNALGWKITFRNLDCRFVLENDEKKIEFLASDQQNQALFLTKIIGDVIIYADSKYSLNPTLFKFTITDNKVK